MQILVLSDVHANLAATETVFAAASEQGAKDAWCLGDLVGYGREPDAVVSLIRSRCSVVLAGNHDLAVAERTPVDWFPDWLAKQLLGHRRALSAENLGWLESLEPQLVGDGRVLFHAA